MGEDRLARLKADNLIVVGVDLASGTVGKGAGPEPLGSEPPDIDRPTTALPVGCTPRLAASQAGSSCVRNVSHL